MPAIQDKAADGTLDATDLQANIKQIDEVGGNVNLTPLAAACKGGQLGVVKLLLEHKADPDKRSPPPQSRTAFYYATARTSTPTDRLAIVQALIAKADINLACDEDENTPLMNAIVQMRLREDFPVVHLLVDNNASQTQPNKQGQTAQTLGDTYKMSRHLRSKDERNMPRAKIVDLVVSFVLLIVAYTNSFSAKLVTDGVVKQLYGISGKRDAKLIEDIKDPKTPSDFKNNLNNYIKSNKTLERFFARDDPFLQTLAENASTLAANSASGLGSSDNIKRLTRLSLYHTIIYCDDSGSMNQDDSGAAKTGTRYQIQRQLVQRIASIATKIVPDDYAGVELHFINSPSPSSPTQLLRDAAEIENAIDSVTPSSGTKIGTNLHSKILQPIYDRIAIPPTPANPRPLKQPVLVCIITDGAPSEPTDTLEKKIVECKKKLTDAKFEAKAVMFCVSQIGTDPKATTFLNGLNDNTRLKEVLHVTAGRLDDRFKQLAANEKQLESWLLHLLTKPIMEGGDTQ